MKKMNRKEALQTLSFLVGGSLLSSQALINWSCSGFASVEDLFSVETVALFGDIADTIIPTTSTPGAKVAKVGPFIALMLKDCYTSDVHQDLKKGLKRIEIKSQKLYSSSFDKCAAEQKLEVLNYFDKEQVEHDNSKGIHFFRLLKYLTTLGYFTSEVGVTKALNYVPVPGRYEACIEYNKGDKLIARL